MNNLILFIVGFLSLGFGIITYYSIGLHPLFTFFELMAVIAFLATLYKE